MVADTEIKFFRALNLCNLVGIGYSIILIFLKMMDLF